MRKIDGYRVENWTYGKLIFGSVPLTDTKVLGMGNEDEEDEETFMCPGIARYYSANFAICTREDRGMWTAKINRELEGLGLSYEERWFRGLETGLSSLCLFAAVCGNNRIKQDVLRETKGVCTLPRDVDDWMRCYTMLTDITAIRSDCWKDLVLEKHLEWGPLVLSPDLVHLTEMFLEAADGDTARDLRDRLQEEIDDATAFEAVAKYVKLHTPPEPEPPPTKVAIVAVSEHDYQLCYWPEGDGNRYDHIENKTYAEAYARFEKIAKKAVLVTCQDLS